MPFSPGHRARMPGVPIGAVPVRARCWDITCWRRIVREWLAAWLLALGACLLALPATGVASAAAGPGFTFDIQMLDPAVAPPAQELVTSGSLDARMIPFDYQAARRLNRDFWLRLRAQDNSTPGAVPTLNISKGRHLQIQAFAVVNGRGQPLPV